LRRCNIAKHFVTNRFTIGVAVAGEREIHNSPLTRRFFDSFKLVRNAR